MLLQYPDYSMEAIPISYCFNIGYVYGDRKETQSLKANLALNIPWLQLGMEGIVYRSVKDNMSTFGKLVVTLMTNTQIRKSAHPGIN